MMKRCLLVLFLSIFFIAVLPADDPDFKFTLVLQKTGTDSLWLNRESNAQTIQTATRVTNYSFPLIQASSTSTEAQSLTLYLHWEKNSDDNNTIEIRLSFVGSEDDDTSTSGFMMNENGGDGGLNYDVSVSASYVVSSENGSETKSWSESITFGEKDDTDAVKAKKRLNATNKRLIKFTPVSSNTTDKTTTTYISPAKIVITVNPASYSDNTYYAKWIMDKQYIGYIRAEMWSI